MSSTNGLMGAAAFRKPGVPYYAESENPVIRQPTLVSPVALQNPAATSTGFLTVGSAAEGVYEGAISIQPGQNALQPVGNQVGLTVRATTLGVNVEIGDNAQDENLLYIAGPDGVAQVYDEKYNQPVQLQTITIVASDPDCTPTGGAEIFRCTQAAVAQAGAGTVQFNRIQVPRSGAYVMQSEIRMGNGAGANTVVLPSAIVGGIPIWNSLALGMQEFSTVIAVPYSQVEVIGGDFAAIDTFASNSLTIKTYSQVLILDATKEYAITLAANSAAWNIGDAGQIKVELIAMC